MTLPLAKLKELAEKATQGEWKYDDHYPMFIGYRHAVIRPYGEAILLGITGVISYNPETRESKYDEQAANDAAFIAAVNPQTVLALVERIEELEAIIKLRGYSTDDLRTVAFLGEGDDV